MQPQNARKRQSPGNQGTSFLDSLANLPKIDPEALKARNYPTPSIYSLSPGSYLDFSPVNRGVHSKNSTQNGTGQTRLYAADPIPALAAYQQMNKKSFNVASIDLDEPILPPDMKKQKSESRRIRKKFVPTRMNQVPPLPRDTQISPLPDLPPKLIQQQRNFSSKVPSPPNTRKISQMKKRSTTSRSKRIENLTTPERTISSLYERLSVINDPLKVVEILQGINALDFFYFMPVANFHKKNRKFNPYDLRIVPWDSVDPNNYSTISNKGVTHFCFGEEAAFTSLSEWKKEHNNYHKVLQIKLFSKFQVWKAFSTWRKTVRRGLFRTRKNELQEKLFILNPFLAPALLTVQTECYAIQHTQKMNSWQSDKTYSKQAFLDEQYQQMSRVSFTLAKFREAIKFFVLKACQRVLLEALFIPDKVNLMSQMELQQLSFEIMKLYEHGIETQDKTYFIARNIQTSLSKRNTPLDQSNKFDQSEIFIDYSGETDLEPRRHSLDILDKRSYTEQAAKRELCFRLARFIKLTDYMIMSGLHSLTLHSLTSLLDHLKQQVSDLT